jgi:hypothetical protein
MKSVVSRRLPFVLFGFVSILVFMFFRFAGTVAASDTPDPAFVTIAGNLHRNSAAAAIGIRPARQRA